LARRVDFTGEFRNAVEFTFRKFRYQNASVPVGFKGSFENQIKHNLKTEIKPNYCQLARLVDFKGQNRN
jgi:hypothetical protein